MQKKLYTALMGLAVACGQRPQTQIQSSAEQAQTVVPSPESPDNPLTEIQDGSFVTAATSARLLTPKLRVAPDQFPGDRHRASCDHVSTVVDLLPVDAKTGWSVIDEKNIPANVTPIYVSASQGLDRANGLSAQSPVQSLARVKTLMLNSFAAGRVPWVFFARGDSWANDRGLFSSLAMSHSSAAVPVLFASYGQPLYYDQSNHDAAHPIGMERRPRLYLANPKTSLGVQIGAQGLAAQGQYFALVGLEIDGGAYTAKGDGVHSGLFFQSLGGLLVEDTYIWGHRVNNVNLDNEFTPTIGTVKFRRSIIGENNNISGNGNPYTFTGQGIYIDNVYQFEVDQSVFDHNGWGRTKAGGDIVGDRTMYRHAIYLQSPLSATSDGRNPGVCHSSVHDSIFTNAVDGNDLKDGGDFYNNLIVRYGLGIDVGYRTLGNIVDNVILDGVNLSLNSTPGKEGIQSGMGVYTDMHFSASHGKYLNISNNLLAHNLSAYVYRTSLASQFMSANTIFNWRPSDDNFKAQSVSNWYRQDTSADSIALYLRSQSLKGNFADFTDRARMISKNVAIANFYQVYSAVAVNTFFRTLFGMKE